MSTRRTALLATAVVAVAALVAGALLLGVRLGTSEPPGDASADAGFLRDMQVHHAQAVEMSMIVRDRTDDPEVRQLAYDIALGQQQQMGQMYAILAGWGLPQTSSEPLMTWMSGSGGGGMAGMAGMDMSEVDPDNGVLMPGMASDQEVARLGEARGAAAARLWLRLMIRHHQGGVAMAAAGAELARDDQVVTLARAMQQAQQAEITAMQQMLDARSA